MCGVYVFFQPSFGSACGKYSWTCLTVCLKWWAISLHSTPVHVILTCAWTCGHALHPKKYGKWSIYIYIYYIQHISTFFFQHRTIEGSASSTFRGHPSASCSPTWLSGESSSQLSCQLGFLEVSGRFWAGESRTRNLWHRDSDILGTVEFRNPEVVLIVSVLSFFGQPIVRQLNNTKHQVSPGKHINAYQCNPIILQSVHHQVFPKFAGASFDSIDPGQQLEALPNARGGGIM
jgi:hypothetical protein